MAPAAVDCFAVIVPAYNASDTIAECLDAILKSRASACEIIIYNDGLTDLSRTALPSNARVIVNRGAPVGPARGRNIAALESDCDVLIFVDADVIVARDAFGLLLDEINSDQQVAAAFGSYDKTPRATRRAALYANLRHHWVHQEGQREAATFWAGLGAVRRDAFWSVGGFSQRTNVPEIEDIELGAKLKRAGARIRLVPEAVGTHCKNWTVSQLWWTDIFRRALPWARLLASGTADAGQLNTAARDRWSAVLAHLALLMLAGCHFSPWCGVALALTGLCYCYLNRGLLRLLGQRGPTVLLAGLALHWIYHLYASAVYVIVKFGTPTSPADPLRLHGAPPFPSQQAACMASGVSCPAAVENLPLIAVLGLMTLISALLLPVNPWPLDGWFNTQYRLFGSFPGADNYTPIAAPAVFYKINHLLAQAFHLGMTDELYSASLAQNALLLLSACFILLASRMIVPRWIANLTATGFLVFVLSTGVGQAMWSDSVVVFMVSALIFLTVRTYHKQPLNCRQFGLAMAASGLVIGALVVTRAVPVVLIPCLAALFFGHFNRRRLLGYVAGVSLISVSMILAMMAANHARFGRFEMTNSSGRHLWESVKTISDRALAASPEYNALLRINPELQGKGWWEIRLPSEASRFGGEELFRTLAREAIRNEPLLFFAQGARKFATTIARSPPSLGFYTVPLQAPRVSEWSSNPLQRQEALPSIAVSRMNLPATIADLVYTLNGYAYLLVQRVYPLAIFLALTALSAIFISKRHNRYGPILQVLFGLPFIALAGFGIVGRWSSVFVVGLCSLSLAVQTLAIHRSSKNSLAQFRSFFEANAALFLFFASAFLGSIWVSWQIESGSARHALSYSPLLAMLLGMTINFWVGELRSNNLLFGRKKSSEQTQASQR